MNARYLADRSALARLNRPSVSARLEPLIETGQIATCSVVMLELLFSARSPIDYRVTRERLSLSFELAEMDQGVLDRAVELQAALAERSQHRGVALPDLMLAATAERHGLIVLHYDADFDLIAVVSGQPMEWVVARGSVP